MNYLAVFYSSQFQDPQGEPWGPIVVGEVRLRKNIPRLQYAVSLMLLSKNLLFSTLGSQIMSDFVWKAQAKYHSFTSNFVKLLYLIIWDARTNLIRFYWNLHHLVLLTCLAIFYPSQFQDPHGGLYGLFMEGQGWSRSQPPVYQIMSQQFEQNWQILKPDTAECRPIFDRYFLTQG